MATHLPIRREGSQVALHSDHLSGQLFLSEQDPYSMAYNLTVERQITPNTVTSIVAEAAYVVYC